RKSFAIILFLGILGERSSLCFRLLVLLWNRGVGGACEQQYSVREGDGPDVARQGAVARLPTIDDECRAGGQILLAPTPAKQPVRAVGLARPILGFAVRTRHVEVDPRVRIRPLHLGHLAGQLQRSVGIELGGKRVMRDGGARDQQRSGGNGGGKRLRSQG